ncbi:unnamed protein product [Meloidogyne enterolobii]|uniref:Uncharacterized protein n=1 Tax=Meloidogyne enterolobii TaxID=390850 RepID=A0ACB0ZSP0_MELEN
MADLCGTPMRPSDSWSSTEVRSLQHSHMWTIKGFSQCECRYLETSLRIKDSAVCFLLFYLKTFLEFY